MTMTMTITTTIGTAVAAGDRSGRMSLVGLGRKETYLL
jgi:hypothetical protein